MPRLLSRALVYAKRSKFLRFGLPFLSFMIIGSFGLSEFTEIRVSIRDSAHGTLPISVFLQVKRNDEKTHFLTAEESLQFQKKVYIYIARHTHTHTQHYTIRKCYTHGIIIQVKSVDAEEELKRTLNELDIEHWVNKRVPRPPGWED